MLAGHGLDDTLAGCSARRRLAGLALPLLLTVASPLAAGLVPAGETGPLGLPRAADLAGWLAALGALTVLLWPARHLGLAWRGPAIGALALAELFAASQVQSINHLTSPEAWTSVRPAMTELLAARGSTPSSRFLALSGLRFEPGDTPELRTALRPALPEDAFYDFIVATKHKEVLSPNLPLAWDVPAVDGYDGGVLPLRHYADFTQLFTGAASADGRLRENITTPPDARLLALVNARYLITDKVMDAWIDGVFYDLEFTLSLAAGERASLAYVPRFQTTAIGLAANGFGGSLALTLDDGSQLKLPIRSSLVALPEPSTPVAITLVGPLTVRGLSLVDTLSGAFQSLTLGPYRLVHSGDVKIYELQTLLPRAFVVPSAEVVSDPEALARLADPGFDPAGQVLLAEPPATDSAMPATGGGAPAIVAYTAERVEVRAAGPGYLVLTDAHYPGWTASVDGEPAPILRADVMFRAVALPPGEHRVIFRFQPRSVSIGLGISGAAWALLLIVGVWLLGARRRSSPP
ncbi:MAG: YfhO family protein [Anaerolineales bacterium]|nr:YfhO family protein [Anaerolineales bacterium]